MFFKTTNEKTHEEIYEDIARKDLLFLTPVRGVENCDNCYSSSILYVLKTNQHFCDKSKFLLPNWQN